MIAHSMRHGYMLGMGRAPYILSMRHGHSIVGIFDIASLSILSSESLRKHWASLGVDDFLVVAILQIFLQQAALFAAAGRQVGRSARSATCVYCYYYYYYY